MNNAMDGFGVRVGIWFRVRVSVKSKFMIRVVVTNGVEIGLMLGWAIIRN